MKGKKARSGNFHPRYEGGQTPLQRRVPKSGFSKRAFSFQPSSYVNLSKILYCIKKGRIDPTKKITIKDLVESGAISSAKTSVYLLGRGGSALSSAKMGDEIQPIPPLNIEVSSASKQAIDFVKASGGTVTCVYRTPLTMRYHLSPEKWTIPPNEPQTPPKKAYSMEKLREQGAEVVYKATQWFKNKNNVKSIAKRFNEKETRAEKLREIGKGVRVKPMLTRRVSYFAGKSKKKKKSKSQAVEKGAKARGKEKGKGKVKEDKGKEDAAKKGTNVGKEVVKEEAKGEAKQDVKSEDTSKQRKPQSVDAKSEKIDKKEEQSSEYKKQTSKKAAKKEKSTKTDSLPKDTKTNKEAIQDSTVNNKTAEKTTPKSKEKSRQNAEKKNAEKNND